MNALKKKSGRCIPLYDLSPNKLIFEMTKKNDFHHTTKTTSILMRSTDICYDFFLGVFYQVKIIDGMLVLK